MSKEEKPKREYSIDPDQKCPECGSIDLESLDQEVIDEVDHWIEPHYKLDRYPYLNLGQGRCREVRIFSTAVFFECLACGHEFEGTGSMAETKIIEREED